MLRHTNSDILIGILVASLFWVGVFVWQSSQPPKNSNIESQHCEGTKSECAKASTDERIADYTWWLAVLTGALVTVSSVQGVFLLRADKTTRSAANAAELSAKASIALALPIVGADSPEMLDVDGLIRADEPYGGSPADFPRRFCAIPVIAFRNEGQTPAFPTKVAVEWRVSAKPSDGQPRFKTYDYISQMIPRNGAWEADVHFGFEIPEAELALLKEPGQFLRLRVTIFYNDFLRKERSAIFNWKWHNPGQGAYFFESDGAPDTQYQQGEETT